MNFIMLKNLIFLVLGIFATLVSITAFFYFQEYKISELNRNLIYNSLNDADKNIFSAFDTEFISPEIYCDCKGYSIGGRSTYFLPFAKNILDKNKEDFCCGIRFSREEIKGWKDIDYRIKIYEPYQQVRYDVFYQNKVPIALNIEQYFRDFDSDVSQNYPTILAYAKHIEETKEYSKIIHDNHEYFLIKEVDNDYFLIHHILDWYDSQSLKTISIYSKLYKKNKGFAFL